MSNRDDAQRFIRDLKININELAEGDSKSLWDECEKVAEPLQTLLGDGALSMLYRIQQGTYYKALDTFVEALSLTLKESADGQK